MQGATLFFDAREAFNKTTIRIIPVARIGLIFVTASWIIGVTQYGFTHSNQVKWYVAIIRHTGISDGYIYTVYNKQDKFQ